MLSLEAFKEECSCLSSKSDKQLFIQKYLFHGIPYIFKDNEVDYFNFRNRIANHFNIKYYEIVIVGSCKLGYSPFRHTMIDFGKEPSDVDVVIVSSELYEYFSKLICEFQYDIESGKVKLRNKLNEDDKEQKRKITPKKKYQKFVQYFIKGWLRPDLLPIDEPEFVRIKNEWFNFFKSISFGNSEVGNRKVTAGLFKSYSYAERNYIRTIK